MGKCTTIFSIFVLLCLLPPKHRCTANRVQKPKGEYRQDNTCYKKQFIVRHSASP